MVCHDGMGQSLQPHKNVISIFLNDISIFFSIKLHVYSYSTHYIKEKVWLLAITE